MNNDRITQVYRGEVSGPASRDAARERVHWMVEQARGPRILDLGCSQGIVSILLARRGLEVIAVDREEPALRFAARELVAEEPEIRARIRLVHADGSRLPLPDAAFDTVVLGEVIEHLEDPGPVLAESRRVLRTEGRLILTTPFGFLPHEDHKRTYYLGSLLNALAPYWSPVVIGVQASHYIRFLGEPRERVAPESDRGRLEEAELERLQEAALLLKEQRYHAQIDRLQERLDAAHLKYRDASAAVTRVVRAAGDAGAEAAASAFVDAAIGRAQVERLTGEVTALRAAVERHDLVRSEFAEMRRVLEGAERDRAARDHAIERLREAEAEVQALHAAVASSVSVRRQRELEVEEWLDAALARQRELTALAEQRLEERESYRQRYANAVRSFQAQKRHGQRLDKEVRRLRYRVRVVEESRSWKVVQLYWRFHRELLHGSRDQRRAFLRDLRSAAGHLLWGRRREVDFDRRLDSYLERVARHRSKHFVLMFSGTAEFQEKRGNRPIRLTRTLLRRRVPVFFSYWRWKTSERIPHDGEPLLFQSPIDLTARSMDRLAWYPLGDRKKIFVITFPHLTCARWVDVFNAAGWVTVYDVRDDWEEFHKVGAARWYSESLERSIAHRVSVVTAVSRPLQEKIQRYLDEGDAREAGRKVVLSPNALDTRYPTGRRVRARPADGLRVAGYVGHLTAAWFDWESLLWVARERTDWRFDIVGHSAPEDLDLPPNVRYLGAREYREIQTLARGWRVALIPFKVSKLSDGVDPIKVYEYLSLGLPVVSFRMPQIHDYPYVYIAESRVVFGRRMDEALRVEVEPEVLRRFLAANRWEDRAKQLLDFEPDEARVGALRTLAGGR